MSVFPRNTPPVDIYYPTRNDNVFLVGKYFDITFTFRTSYDDTENANNLVVKYHNISTNEDILLVLNEDYEFIPNSQYSSDADISQPIEETLGIYGKIRLVKRLENVSYLSITRQIEVSQLLDFNYSGISQQDIGYALDKVTMIAQDQQHTSGNVRMPIDKVVLNNVSGDIAFNGELNSLLAVKDNPSEISSVFLDNESLRFQDETDAEGNPTGRRLLAAIFKNVELDRNGNINVYVIPQEITVGDNMTISETPIERSFNVTPSGDDDAEEEETDDNATQADENDLSENNQHTYTGKEIVLNAIPIQKSSGEKILDIQPITVNGKKTAWELGTNLTEFNKSVKDVLPPVLMHQAGQWIKFGDANNLEEVGQQSFIVQFIKDNITTFLDGSLRSILTNYEAEDQEDELLIQQMLQDGHTVNTWGAEKIVKIILPNIIDELPWWIKIALPEDLQQLSDDRKVLRISCTLQNGLNISIDEEGHINCTLAGGDYISINENTINCTLAKSTTVRFTSEEDKHRLEAPVVSIAQDSQDVLSCTNILENSNENVSVENPITGFEIAVDKDGLANVIKEKITLDLEFKNSLKGEPGQDGAPGRDGQDGRTPQIEIRDNTLYIDDQPQPIQLSNAEQQRIDVDMDGKLFINGVAKGYVSRTEGIPNNGLSQLHIISSDGLIAEKAPVISQDGQYTFDLTCTPQFKENLENQITNTVYEKLLDKYNHEDNCNCNSSGDNTTSGGTTVNVNLPEIRNNINQEIQQMGSDLNTTISAIAEKAAEKVANDPTSNTYKVPTFTAGDNVYITGGYGKNVDEEGNVTNKNDTDETSLFKIIFDGVLNLAPKALQIAAPEWAPVVEAVRTFVSIVNQYRANQSVGAWYDGIPDAIRGNGTFLGSILDKVKELLPANIQALVPGNYKQLDTAFNAALPIYTLNARDYNYSSPNGTIDVNVTENGNTSTDITLDISASAMQTLKGEKGDKGDPGVNGGESFGITFEPSVIINNIGHDTDVVPGGNTIINGGNVVINNHIYNTSTQVSNKSALFSLLHNVEAKSAPAVKIKTLNTIEMIKVFYLPYSDALQTSSSLRYYIIGIDNKGQLFGCFNDSWNLIGSLLPSNLPSNVTPIISSASLSTTKKAILLVASNINYIYVATYNTANNVTTITGSSAIDTSTYCASPYGQNGGMCCDYNDNGSGGYNFYVVPSNSETAGALLRVSINNPSSPVVTTIADYDKSQCPGDIYQLKCSYIYGVNAQQYDRSIIVVTKTGNIYRKIASASGEYFSIANVALSNNASAEVTPLGVMTYSQSSLEEYKNYNLFIFFKYRTITSSEPSVIYTDWQYSCIGLTGQQNTFITLDPGVTIPEISNIVDGNTNLYSASSLQNNYLYDDTGACYLVAFSAHSSSTATLNKIQSVTRITSEMEDSAMVTPIGNVVTNDKLIFVLRNNFACSHYYFSYFDYDISSWSIFEKYSTILGSASNYTIVKTKYIFEGYASALINLTHDNNQYQLFIWTEDGGETWRQKNFVLNSNYIDFICGNDGILFIPQGGRTYAMLASASSEIEYKELPTNSGLTFDDAVGGFSLTNKYCVIIHNSESLSEVSILKRTQQSEEVTWAKEDYEFSDLEDYDRVNKSLVSVGDVKLNDTLHSVVAIPLANRGFVYAVDGTTLQEDEFIDVAYNLDIEEDAVLSKPVFNGVDTMAILCHEYNYDNYSKSQIVVYQIENYFGSVTVQDEPLVINCPDIASYRPYQLIYIRNNQQWALFYQPINDNSKNMMVVLSNEVLTIDNAKSYEIFGTSQSRINTVDLDTLSFNQYGYFVTGTNNFIYSQEPMPMLQTILYLSNEVQNLREKERSQLITDVENLNATIASIQNQIATLNSNISVATNNRTSINQINTNITNIQETDEIHNTKIAALEQSQTNIVQYIRQLADVVLTITKTDEAVKAVESVKEQYVPASKLNHLLTHLRFITGGDNSGASTVNSEDPVTWHALTWAERTTYGGKYGGRKIHKWSDMDLATQDEPDRYVSMTINLLAEGLYQALGNMLMSSVFANVNHKYFNEGELLKLAYSVGTLSVNPNYSGEYNRSRAKVWAELTYGAGARFINTAAGRTIIQDIENNGETAYNLNSDYVAPTTKITGQENHYDVPAFSQSEAVEFLLALRKSMAPIQIPASEQRRFLNALKTGGSAYDSILWNYLLQATAYRKQHRKKSVLDMIAALTYTMPSFGGGTISLGGGITGQDDSGSLSNLDWMGTSFSDLSTTLGDDDWLINLDGSTSLSDSGSDWLIKL